MACNKTACIRMAVLLMFFRGPALGGQCPHAFHKQFFDHHAVVMSTSPSRKTDLGFSRWTSSEILRPVHRRASIIYSSGFPCHVERPTAPSFNVSFHLPISVLPLPLWHSPGAAQTSRVRQFLSILHFMALSVSGSLVSSSPAPSALSRDGLSFFCSITGCVVIRLVLPPLFHSRPCATTGSVASLIMYKRCSVLPAKKQQLLLMCCFAIMFECCACDQDTGQRSSTAHAPCCKSSSDCGGNGRNERCPFTHLLLSLPRLCEHFVNESAQRVHHHSLANSVLS